MPSKDASRDAALRDRWTAQVAAFDGERVALRRRKAPITTERILDTALKLVEAQGFDALTMRRVAAALETGPASLYAHVRDCVIKRSWTTC